MMEMHHPYYTLSSQRLYLHVDLTDYVHKKIKSM